jgi:APA family basic amino acid/polyamine antiporter
MLPRVDASEASGHPLDRLERKLGPFDAAMLVVASVVGAGIFFTPGQVAALLPAPQWILLAWALGGLLSLAGALANAELGAMYPRAGGDYVYLSEAFHPVAGFLVGWMTFFAIYAGTIAALALAFGEGIGSRLGLGDAGVLGVAVAITLALSALNYFGVQWGARANNLTSLLKIGALVAFVAIGPFTGAGDGARLWAAEPAGGAAIGWSDFGRALSPILFTYLGWNASVYVASEIRSPGRNIPRSLFLGLGICTAVYLAVNAVYLYALPMDALVGVTDAGEAAGLSLFGAVGGTVVGAFVLLSVLGTLNATVLVGPRIAYAMALDGLFFPGVDRVHAAWRTPTIAISVQAAVAVGLLLLLRGFPSALDFTVFGILLATSADVLALYRLRALEPGRPRPYRAWGHPWLPGLYLGANVAIAVAMAIGSPFECAASLALLAAALPFYWTFVRGRGRAEAGSPGRAASGRDVE